MLEKVANYPVEILKFQVENSKIAKQFLEVDNQTWTKYLAKQPGFIEKYQWYTTTEPSDIFTIIIWQDVEKWQAINKTELAKVEKEFKTIFNEQFKKDSFFKNRSFHPLRKISQVKNKSKAKVSVVEYLVFEVDNLTTFLENDYNIWTSFLKTKEGFIQKQHWQNSQNKSEIHSIVFWEKLENWTQIKIDDLIQKSQEFAKREPKVKIKCSVHEQYNKQIKNINKEYYDKNRT